MMKQAKDLRKQIMGFHVLGSWKGNWVSLELGRSNSMEDLTQTSGLCRQSATYKSAKSKSEKFDYDDVPNHCDILLFGPAGSGKSSLIKTWYRALHEAKDIPLDIAEKLKIKAKN